jgi:SAM-dependent methyltransferase
MTPRDLDEFRHPRTGARLTLQALEERAGEIVRGNLSADGDAFEIVDGIPRFCPRENYSESFGFQWTTFNSTQLDSKSRWGNWSEKRLFEESGWPRDMKGQRILEAGCGMGRFSEVIAKTGARLCTFDYSRAVDANRNNNGQNANLCFAQADIYQPPFEKESFDRVICVGVLQHCPSPHGAFESLVRFVRPGGHLFIDHYRLWWKSFFLGKYYLRPLTRLVPPRKLFPLVKGYFGLMYPLTGLLRPALGNMSRGLSWGVGIADYRGYPDIDPESARELSLLDTYDMLAPAYDRPKTIATVRRWLEDAGLIDIEVFPAANGLAARGRKPK